jgi:hypothetical protein
VQQAEGDVTDMVALIKRVLSTVLQGVIDSGSLVQQASVIAVLRIVPFAPFRCSL